MTFFGSFLSQCVRLKRSPLLWFHIFCATVPALACGSYFAHSHWNSLLGTDTFMQIIGAFMPFAVTIVMSFDIDTERQTGELSAFLGVPSRVKSVLGKLCAYLVLCAVTLASATGIFTALLSLEHREIPHISTLALSVLALIVGSIILYPLALWCTLATNRNATIALGTVFSLVAIGSLGGLAHSLVSGQLSTAQSSPLSFALPMTWPARMTSVVIEHGIDSSISLVPLTMNALIALGAASIVMIIVCMWITRFEDRKRVD